MKRGTESIVRLGKGVEPAGFSGINVLSTVILGKKESATKDFNGLFITDAVLLGKKISHSAVVTATVHGVSPLSLPSAVANSLSYVKAFGGTEQRNLPDGYTQLDYIESTGTQYIDTGYYPNQNTSVEITYMNTGENGDAAILLGTTVVPAQTDASNGLVFLLSPNRVGFGNGVGTTVNLNGTVGNVANTKYTLRFDKNVVSWNGGNVTVVPPKSATWSAPNSLYLFGRNTAGTLNYPMIGRIYSYKAWNNGTLVQNFVPVKYVSGGTTTYGMYDLMDDNPATAFHTNAGTGTFAAGGEAVPTPDAPMDIVSNNGVLKLSPNLINLAATTAGYYYQPNGTYTESSPSRLTDYIPVKAGQKYTVYYKIASTAQSQISVRINFFNSSKVWQSQEVLTLAVGAEDVKIITATIDGYVRISANSYATSGLNADWDTAQMVSGEYTVATMPTYRPYGIYTNGTVETITDALGNTATAEMLLKVGDYQDVQSIIDGAITRNVGVKVLDGTETITASVRPNVFLYDGLPRKSTKELSLCSHYTYTAASTADMANNTFGVSENSARIYFKDERYATVPEFQAFLAAQYAAGTPVIVIYPLATPTTESVTGQTLQVTDGDNVLEITQASLSGLELEAEYQAAVSLTIQEVQDANLDPNVEVTIN